MAHFNYSFEHRNADLFWADAVRDTESVIQITFIQKGPLSSYI